MAYGYIIKGITIEINLKMLSSFLHLPLLNFFKVSEISAGVGGVSSIFGRLSGSYGDMNGSKGGWEVSRSSAGVGRLRFLKCD